MSSHREGSKQVVFIALMTTDPTNNITLVIPIWRQMMKMLSVEANHDGACCAVNGVLQ